MNKVLKLTKLYECSDHDRYIYVEYTNGKLTSINYWQGISDEVDQSTMNNDPDLLKFYNAIHDALYHMSENEVDQFNYAIDMHFEYKDNY
jgi:hypothetical protein